MALGDLRAMESLFLLPRPDYFQAARFVYSTHPLLVGKAAQPVLLTDFCSSSGMDKGVRKEVFKSTGIY